jgi:hypothetical protein
MKIDPANYVRPGNAARIAGVTRAFIVRLCNDGRIGCFRVCQSWFVSLPDAEKYRTSTPGKVPPKARVAPPRKQAKVDPTLFVTMSTAAGLAGCARQHMNREVRANRVPGVWIDGQWIVLRSAAIALDPQPLGRPRIHPLPRILETPANQQQPTQAANQRARRRKPQQG